MLHAVILAGGGGTRLWPLSRANYPKQFLKLLGNHTLLQQTVLRLDGSIPPERLWVVTGREQAPVVRAQLAALPNLGRAQVVSEPVPKNTAAAIGVAAVYLRQQDPEAVMVVLPADHWIEREKVFVALLHDAAALAQQGALVTLGVVPDRPETGYGYIRRGAPLTAGSTSLPAGQSAYRVEQFVEKPNESTARHYLTSGAYYWNAGIFLWRATTILEEIAACVPALYEGLEEISRHLTDDKAGEILAAVYPSLEAVSIDYGVLEKCSRLVVVPADIGWSDLGEWTAVHRLSPRDDRGNTLSPNVLALDSENSFIYGNRRMIATIGLKNTVVVDADDALLICSSDRAQEVKAVVQHLHASGAEMSERSRVVHRPWGTYTVLEEGAQFKVKRIVVYPGAALSLQLHHYRSEHWIVVAGTAQVTKGEPVVLLQANQSAYIPHETKHRLVNPGTEPLEVIEVQTGSYLGEDDIVRFEDLYQRVSA
jgi:mannose-1-phosphate guanylyltransferase/mannose-6-phosphate isomerase